MKRTILVLAVLVGLSHAVDEAMPESVRVAEEIAVGGCESALSGDPGPKTIALKLLFDGADYAIFALRGEPTEKNPPDSSVVEECKVWKNTGISPLTVHIYTTLLRYYGRDSADAFLRELQRRKRKESMNEGKKREKGDVGGVREKEPGSGVRKKNGLPSQDTPRNEKEMGNKGN